LVHALNHLAHSKAEEVMLDLLLDVPPTKPAATPVREVHHPVPAHWYALMLDEIDYGVLLIADQATVLYANHVARTELDADHPLQLLGQQLRLRDSADIAALHRAIDASQDKGLRRLLSVGRGAQSITVAVVPLPRTQSGDEPHTLLVFGKRRVCEALSAQWFAQSHGLTTAEARVLAALCEGAEPNRIAEDAGVAISTVRTQISSIRAKTGADSIRELVRQVAVLPPLVGVLRGTPAH
jgi:DNA-binding CsgD family transcriptional regulator